MQNALFFLFFLGAEMSVFSSLFCLLSAVSFLFKTKKDVAAIRAKTTFCFSLLLNLVIDYLK